MRLTTVFAKRPVPGGVKTRLCPPLRPEEAAELALAMLDDTVAKCTGCEAFETSIAAAGDPSWFRARFAEVGEVSAQEGADLGERLARHFDRAASSRPGSSLVVVGADSPQVPEERIVRAHEVLEGGTDVVLGPDRGGGYYLVGLVRPVPDLFERVEMSTPTMLARTLEVARGLGLSVHLLAEDYDVDTPEDLAALACEPRELRSARLLARIPALRR